MSFTIALIRQCNYTQTFPLKTHHLTLAAVQNRLGIQSSLVTNAKGGGLITNVYPIKTIGSYPPNFVSSNLSKTDVETNGEHTFGHRVRSFAYLRELSTKRDHPQLRPYLVQTHKARHQLEHFLSHFKFFQPNTPNDGPARRQPSSPLQQKSKLTPVLRDH